MLKLSSYSLRARLDKDINTPLEWILEGSNEMKSWSFLHHKERGYELAYRGNEGNWEVDAKVFFRMFKLTMLGENIKYAEDQRFIFSLNKVEVFGTLSPFKEVLSCKGKQRNIPNVVYVLMLCLT